MRALLVSTSLALLLVAISSQAQTVYKYTDKNGNQVFSDSPVAGAEKVEVQSPSTVQMAPVKLPPTPTPAPAATTDTYENVVITTPSQDAVYSNEPGPILITGRSTPGLRAGHNYRFSVNGQSSPELKTPSYSFEAPDRGTFTVILEIVDSNLHALAQSPPVTFHVKRHSKLFKAPTAPGPVKR